MVAVGAFSAAAVFAAPGGPAVVVVDRHRNGRRSLDNYRYRPARLRQRLLGHLDITFIWIDWDNPRSVFFHFFNNPLVFYRAVTLRFFDFPGDFWSVGRNIGLTCMLSDLLNGCDTRIMLRFMSWFIS